MRMQGFFFPSSRLLFDPGSSDSPRAPCFRARTGRANLHGAVFPWSDGAVQICTTVFPEARPCKFARPSNLENMAVQICTARPSSKSDVAVQICTDMARANLHPGSSGPHPVASRSHPGACPAQSCIADAILHCARHIPITMSRPTMPTRSLCHGPSTLPSWAPTASCLAHCFQQTWVSLMVM